MISNFKEIIELFEKLDKVVGSKINIYVIGGAVLLEQNLKLLTKDIDLVVDTKHEFTTFQHALIKFGFKPQIPGKEYSHMNLSQVFQSNEYRIDLFKKKVCKQFSLSKEMMLRARKSISLNNLQVFLCSNEDIFLFKTMTEREGDLGDCENLVFPGINWKIIIEELKNQIENSKQDIWITWVGERFDILQERGMIIPIMNELNKLRLKYFNDLEKKLQIK